MSQDGVDLGPMSRDGVELRTHVPGWCGFKNLCLEMVWI